MPITADRALAIASTDASAVYPNLHLYHMTIQLEPSGWVVEFDWRGDETRSGGPHYVIDATSGAITHATYYQ